MRGADTFTESLFSVRKLDDFVPPSHPLRSIRVMANEALAKMDRVFAGMYEADIKGGRPSIAPEKLLRAMLLQVLYSIRSERQLMEQTQYNLLFRWFIGLSMDDSVWVPTVFTKNRERLIRHDAVVEFFNEVLAIAQQKDWLSGQRHFQCGQHAVRRGPDIKALCARMAKTKTMMTVAATSEATSAANQTHQSRPIPMRVSIAKATRPANCGTWAIR